MTVRPIRVLVVDDSVIARQVLSTMLSADPELEIAGTAATASIALQKIEQVVPDVVLLDATLGTAGRGRIERGGRATLQLDGIEVLRKIRDAWPKLPVILSAPFTEHGSEASLRVIAKTASDVITKASVLDTPAFATLLISKVKALRPADVTATPAQAASSSPPHAVSPAARVLVSAIGIGSSTGGPNALATLFSSLPRDLAVPIFVAQHMPPMFTKMLADRITSTTGFRVAEAVDGELVEPGRAYVAPGDFHMMVVREGSSVRIALNQGPRENSCRPAVDVLFRSMAAVYGSGALVAILTGMGQDGTRGARDITLAGGRVIVQDAASSVVASMPTNARSVVEIDGEYSIDTIGSELAMRTRPRTTLQGMPCVLSVAK